VTYVYGIGAFLAIFRNSLFRSFLWKPKFHENAANMRAKLLYIFGLKQFRTCSVQWKVGSFRFGSVWLGSVRFGRPVRFGSVRQAGSVRFGSVRFGSVRQAGSVRFGSAGRFGSVRFGGKSVRNKPPNRTEVRSTTSEGYADRKFCVQGSFFPGIMICRNLNMRHDVNREKCRSR
jgi:hypothetical protein